MTRDDIIRLAREAGASEFRFEKEPDLTLSRMTKIERFASLVAAAEREKVTKWMLERGYATGHGDTTEDLLQELEWQILEGWNRALINGVETEREACAKVCEEWLHGEWHNQGVIAAMMIRERGAP